MKTKIKKIIGLLLFVPICYCYATFAVEIAEQINGATDSLKIAVALAVYVSLIVALVGGGMLLMGDD